MVPPFHLLYDKLSIHWNKFFQVQLWCLMYVEQKDLTSLCFVNQAKGLKVTCLLCYCSEGDNIPDAFHLAEAACKLLRLSPENFHGEFCDASLSLACCFILTKHDWKLWISLFMPKLTLFGWIPFSSNEKWNWLRGQAVLVILVLCNLFQVTRVVNGSSRFHGRLCMDHPQICLYFRLWLTEQPELISIWWCASFRWSSRTVFWISCWFKYIENLDSYVMGWYFDCTFIIRFFKCGKTVEVSILNINP